MAKHSGNCHTNLLLRYKKGWAKHSGNCHVNNLLRYKKTVSIRVDVMDFAYCVTKERGQSVLVVVMTIVLSSV